MQHCCGEDRRTKFCPECGRPLAASPLVALLDHLNGHIKMDTRRLENYSTTPNLSRDEEKQRLRIKRNLDKWTRWRDALAEVIQKADANPTVQVSQPV